MDEMKQRNRSAVFERISTIEDAIDALSRDEAGDRSPVFDAILDEMRLGTEFIVPVIFEGNEEQELSEREIHFQYLTDGEGNRWAAVFTGWEECNKGQKSSTVPISLRELMSNLLEEENLAGLVINPWGRLFSISKEIFEGMLEASRPLTQDELDLNAGSAAYNEGDYETALRLYRKSAAAGNVTAMSNLGYCYYYGRSIPVDKEQARTCWEKAAILGDPCAIYKLGDMYRNGDLEQDLKFSGLLYHRAFQIAYGNEDINSYPDASLRLVKYCSDELDADLREQLLQLAIDGFCQRLDYDPFAAGLLKEAESLK